MHNKLVFVLRNKVVFVMRNKLNFSCISYVNDIAFIIFVFLS